METETTGPVERDNEPSELSEESLLVADANERHDVDEFVPDGLEDEANISTGEEVAAEEVLRRIADAGAAF